MEHDHSSEAIARRLAAGPGHNYLRDWIYGGIDGAVTTLAVVSGVVGAQLSPRIILVMGFANLVADGFSMAASNFLGTRAEYEDLKRIEAIENRHIDLAPEGEREEVRQIFLNKGFVGEDLTRIVDLVTADRTRWVRTMLTEEYGLPREVRSPWMAALATFSAFIACGLVPLLPYLFVLNNSVALSMMMTGGVFFTSYARPLLAVILIFACVSLSIIWIEEPIFRRTMIVAGVCLTLWVTQVVPPYVPTFVLWALTPLLLHGFGDQFQLTRVLG